MRTLSVLEMDAVSGGEKTRLQNLGQCVVNTLTAGAAGGALGALAGPLGMKIGAAAGMIGSVIGSDACIAGLN